MKTLNKGFTLIELMIVVAVIAILAAIAIPSYTDYLRRGAIPEGLAGLSDQKVKLEQYFSDNRAYTGTGTNSCDSIHTTNIKAGRFTIDCIVDPVDPAVPESLPGYTLTATGDAGTLVDGFVYTLSSIGNTGTKATTSTGVWNKNNASCWILKKDGSC